MEYQLSNVEVFEWTDPAEMIEALTRMDVLEKLPQLLTFSYDFYPIEENQLPISITWSYSVFSKAVAIFKYVGTTKTVIKMTTKSPSIKEIYKMIHDLFFQFEIYFSWQLNNYDPFAVEMQELPDNRFFNFSNELREKLGISISGEL